MAARTDLDRPDDAVVECGLCGKPLKVRYEFIVTLNKWWRPSVHQECLAQRSGTKAAAERKIPERFSSFDPKLCDPEALVKAQQFSPDSRQHVLAILGPPKKGKSRLAWAIAGQYFDLLFESSGAKRWIDYHIEFEAFIAEFDRHAATRIAQAKFALIDDVGVIDCFGQARALLQAGIRSRIKANRPTILTIDDLSFDLGLESLLKDRAIVVVIT